MSLQHAHRCARGIAVQRRIENQPGIARGRVDSNAATLLTVDSDAKDSTVDIQQELDLTVRLRCAVLAAHEDWVVHQPPVEHGAA